MHVVVPPNTTATVFIPAKKGLAIREDGRQLAQLKGVKMIGVEEAHTLLKCVSGDYRFEAF